MCTEILLTLCPNICYVWLYIVILLLYASVLTKFLCLPPTGCLQNISQRLIKDWINLSNPDLNCVSRTAIAGSKLIWQITNISNCKSSCVFKRDMLWHSHANEIFHVMSQSIFISLEKNVFFQLCNAEQ